MSKYLGDPQSGSRRNDTYSRNRYGQYVRNRSIPVNPQTSYQGTVRAAFGAAAQAWASLTNAQRASWEAYASTHPVIDSLGQFKYLTGSAIYVKIRAQQSAASITIGVLPPAEPSFVANPSLAVSAAETGQVMTITGDDQPTNYKAMVYATPQLSPGRSYPVGRKLVRVVASSMWSTPVSFITSWSDRFGTLQAGKKIIYDVRLVSDDGVYGPIDRVSAIVGA